MILFPSVKRGVARSKLCILTLPKIKKSLWPVRLWWPSTKHFMHCATINLLQTAALRTAAWTAGKRAIEAGFGRKQNAKASPVSPRTTEENSRQATQSVLQTALSQRIRKRKTSFLLQKSLPNRPTSRATMKRRLRKGRKLPAPQGAPKRPKSFLPVRSQKIQTRPASPNLIWPTQIKYMRLHWQRCMAMRFP